MSISEIYESSEQKSNIAHFAAIANIALADGEINDEESSLLQQFANKLNINEHQYKQIMKSLDKYPIPSANTIDERLEYLFELFRMIYVDHEMDGQELKLVHKYAIGLGCNSEKATDIIMKSSKIFGGDISFDNYKYLLDNMD
jgi:uncharacterized tellurite resistance protein B-like protein